MIFGARVEQAREFRCLTQVDLASRIGVNQTAIARLESGGLALSDEKVRDLAEVLGFPLSFFERDIPEFFPMGSLEFRANATTPAKEKKRAHQYASITFELAATLATRLKTPSLRLPRLSGAPEEAAAQLRSELALSPKVPIRNLTAVLERAGVAVFALPDLRAGCDGFSVWAALGRKLTPAIFVSADSPGDRERHTIAHEVGELTLEDMPAGHAREKIASQFAGALLMPADALRRDLVPPIDLTDFLDIKLKYGVSIQSAIMRARQLGMISATRYKVFYRKLSALGWRIVEPGDAVPPEKPRALHKMVELLYGSQVDFVRLAEDARLDPWFIRRLLSTHASAAEVRGGPPKSGIVVPLHDKAGTLEQGDDSAVKA